MRIEFDTYTETWQLRELAAYLVSLADKADAQRKAKDEAFERSMELAKERGFSGTGICGSINPIPGINNINDWNK